MDKLIPLAAVLLAIGTPAHAALPTPTHTPSHTMNHNIPSKHSFDDTVRLLEDTIRAKGMTVFAVIDHQAAARQSGLDMQPAKVIIFGTPKAGTPLMVKDPEFALRLPLRVLITQTGEGVRVVYPDTHELIAGSRIGFAEVENTLANAEKLIAKTVSE